MINNAFYKDLGEAWYTAEGDVVALLRRENETKAPWVRQQLRAHVAAGARVLDVGCGGGFLTLDLAEGGYRMVGLDVAPEVMESGRRRDVAGRITWAVGTAECLPFADHSFEAVCMMDVLEHVADWRGAVREVARVLKPGGVFIFHTFNRTWLSWLFAARGIEWFLKGPPGHVHLWRMFIKPRELACAMEHEGLRATTWSGINPRVISRAFLRLLIDRRVPADFAFRVGGSRRIGYLGVSVRSV